MTDDADERCENTLSAVADAVGDLVTGIPAPIRKNALRAFTRLCTAAVEYPVALIESAIGERRAEAQARIKLINASAEQIAGQLQVHPEYARLAASKFAQKIVRERANLDSVSKVAALELECESTDSLTDPEIEVPVINEDWLNAFETEASQMSSEQMQALFGKILAGEIKRPSSYSRRTLRIIAQLDNRAANIFRTLCSLSLSLRDPRTGEVLDARVVSMGNAGSNSLLPYGLNFGALNILHEHGLIISDYNSFVPYDGSVLRSGKVALPITYQGERWALVPTVSEPEKSQLQIHGVALSQSGKELLSVVDIEQNPSYTTALTSFFAQKGLTFNGVVPEQMLFSKMSGFE